eukprot:TRINITY_DN3409_c0_g1_i2.p1 TRINITY_DN3409_c0_g1~~TRINITY_DN3409_c0_g1_i2.p1  ORF type:complete len:148 (-),score=29.39 TRINITY_DN3409_c0_g1_i2:459-902(-)
MAFDPNFAPADTVIFGDDIEDDVDIIQHDTRQRDDDEMDADVGGGRNKRRARKRGHNEIVGGSYVSPEDLLALRQTDHQAIGWRPVYSEDQERMMRWLALQNPEAQQNGSKPTEGSHPGSARAAGYGSPFYQPNSDPSYEDDPDRMT